MPTDPVQGAARMRAAVLVARENANVNDGHDTIPRFSSERRRHMVASLVLLAPGVRAAGLGRGALTKASSGWTEAGLGEPQRFEARLPHWALIVLRYAGEERVLDKLTIPGPIDVPVLVDPANGRVLAFDEAELLAEAAPWRDVAIAIWRREEGWLRTPRAVLGAPRSAVHFARGLGREWRDGISDLATDLRSTAPGPEAGERPDGASHEPIEGVDYRLWVTVRAGLVRDTVHPSHVELYTTHRGVPPGRWAAIDAAWSARAAADPRVGTWSAHDLRRLETWGALW